MGTPPKPTPREEAAAREIAAKLGRADMWEEVLEILLRVLREKE